MIRNTKCQALTLSGQLFIQVRKTFTNRKLTFFSPHPFRKWGHFHHRETGRTEPQKGGQCFTLNIFSLVGAHFRFSFCFKPMQTLPSVADALVSWPPRLTAREPVASNGAINQRAPRLSPVRLCSMGSPGLLINRNRDAFVTS